MWDNHEILIGEIKIYGLIIFLRSFNKNICYSTSFYGPFWETYCISYSDSWTCHLATLLDREDFFKDVLDGICLCDQPCGMIQHIQSQYFNSPGQEASNLLHWRISYFRIDELLVEIINCPFFLFGFIMLPQYATHGPFMNCQIKNQ